MLLALPAGFLKWQDGVTRSSQLAGTQAVAAARDATVAMLSYQPDSVEADLGAAKERLTGTFLDDYTRLIDEVVIPGAKQQRISAVADVPAAASVSAEPDRAVTLLFVNQTTNVGTEPPIENISTVRVTMDKIGGRWLVSGFEPV
ncbi:hypothetical protein [Mycolicibacterium sp. XJ1819]